MTDLNSLSKGYQIDKTSEIKFTHQKDFRKTSILVSFYFLIFLGFFIILWGYI